MSTVTVRISSETHSALKELAASGKQSLRSVLTDAVERYRRERFLAQCNADYARLRRDKEAWAEELAERASWDVTLLDGLEEE
ncbi:MAG: hypothetical protein AUJ96_28015 [Armatimonadetes bacterium CG2_30_66_41]|nr:toxin-antitoxin system protein [Armatimonadota bacterium]OIO94826.1 MAG: hypothetical protein AUJ96_28015 [Armatimonadetes bacterium CG2_30_66_41]PIX47654.1 MAG: toxin-antitoxin system protein [Armatimonadetes bacterium CG_4_8_14_3_um_filter_66_20]PJB71701.1 MAG: toxin-antitoxin system protein [Armatimonadetes bacterium CG_4_9_14_3_um_filter_66_14]NCO92682.1 toxin-antitoxin system protein [Armatimonadota bacterium]